MTTIAGRFQIVAELYRKGFLCKCNKTEEVLKYTEDGEQIEEEIVHENNCGAPEKMKELLNG